MRIGYFADGPWSHRAFEKIVADPSMQISFICVRHDLQDSVLKRLGCEHGIPVFADSNVNAAEFLERISKFECDVLVSMSFNQIFKSPIVDLAPMKLINCHAGKLPFYRGRNILNWALINDEKEFGITVHYVDFGIDTGDIILQRTCPIADSDDYRTLLEVAYVECASILYEALTALRDGRATRTKQSSLAPVGFYCGRRRRGDELINWHQTSRELFNFIRAICEPGPKALTHLDSQSVKINRARFIPEVPKYKGFPGQILERTDGGFLVKSEDGYLEIREVESDARLKVGDRLVSCRES